MCYGDTWAFDADRAAWSRLNATNAPIHRYCQSLVRDAETGVVYLFGGESYKPYMYHNVADALRPRRPRRRRPGRGGRRLGGAAAVAHRRDAARLRAAGRRAAAEVAAAASLTVEPPKLWTACGNDR